jgi:hypothetical protein
MGRLEKLLADFDYKKKDTLPYELVDAANRGESVHTFKDSGSLSLVLKPISLERKQVKDTLERFYGKKDKLVVLSVSENRERHKVYFNPYSGVRISDRSGLHEWLESDNKLFK